MLQLMREGCSYTYPPLSVARYSCIQLSELEQCRVKKLAQGFNTAAQDSKPGSRSRESEALPLSHCVLLVALQRPCYPESSSGWRLSAESCQQRVVSRELSLEYFIDAAFIKQIMYGSQPIINIFILLKTLY